MCRCHVVPYPSLTIINRPSRSPAILRFTTSSSWLLLLFTSNTSHKYLPLRIVIVTSRIAPHYSL